MRTRHLLVGAVMTAVAVIEFAVVQGVRFHPEEGTASFASGRSNGNATVTGKPYDVSHLIKPEKKYFGVALDGKVTDKANVTKFAELIGKQPNLLTVFESFDDDFAAAEVRSAYQQGALPIVRWEPLDVPLADITAGKQDKYIRKFAQDVRTLNIPIAMTWAHEMNGEWYSWGYPHEKGPAYVAAWKHIWNIFDQADAKNVIWAWTPNVITARPKVKLEPFYPGDKYVDWIGIDGYFVRYGPHTYKSLYTGTKKQIRTFTQKPFLIVETAAEPYDRATWIDEMYQGVLGDPDMLGIVYFNRNGSAKWKINADDSAVEAMKKNVADEKLGFEVK